MKRVWELFEHLNEYVYASDIDKHEIVYMNEKARKKFGYNSVEETKCKKCYEIIHNYDTPCENCNAESMTPNVFLISHHYDKATCSNIILKNTLIEDNDKRIKLEIAIATDEYKEQKIFFQSLEAIVNKGLRISLREPTPDKSLVTLLEFLGKALDAERTYIFERNADNTDSNTYEWTAPGITPEIDSLQDLPPEVCANWYSSFSEKNNIIINDIENIRETDKDLYDILKPQGIVSLVVVPLYQSNRVIGFFGVDNPPHEQINYASDMLEIMGHFIVALIERRNLIKRLETMSFTDQLTNLGNRHAMQDFIQNELAFYDNVGVLFCDITGLKRINDQNGHEAGDKYIISACECLSKAFEGFRLFRIGGDELLVLCPGISKKELNEKIKILKKYLDESSVAMAIGAVWKEGKLNFDEALTEAESLMYQDKAKYYKVKGIDRRR